MVTFQAVHGTSEKRSNNIAKMGFVDNPGLLGMGVYFWKASAYSRVLAIEWFVFRRSQNGYFGEIDPKCVVINVEINSNENEILDLMDPQIAEALIELKKRQQIGSEITAEQTSELIDLFVEELENYTGIKIKVLVSRGILPPKTSYPIEFLPLPLVLLARDLNCISIKGLEPIDEKEISQYV